jgi:hypothetical protein
MQYRRIIFILGCFLGVVLAWAFRSPDLQLEGLLDSVDVAEFFDDIKAALPSALPIGLLREAREIQEHTRQTAGTGAFSIGEQMLRDGMSANYPVIMVEPLESSPHILMGRFRGSFLPAWRVGQLPIARKLSLFVININHVSCSLPYFRKRLWVSPTSLSSSLTEGKLDHAQGNAIGS